MSESVEGDPIIEIENKNRQLYKFREYSYEPCNLPALQNYMFSADGQMIEYKNY